jgi:cobalt-precorrin-5B (C1)-methyltransferase
MDLTAEEVIEVGNEWGYTLTEIKSYQSSEAPFEEILLWGHPGKLAKLAGDMWDTHSSRSGPAVDIVRKIAGGIVTEDLSPHLTTEGLFAALEEDARARLAGAVSGAIANACREKAGGKIDVSVVLVNMTGDLLGTDGKLKRWRWKSEKR